MLALPVKKELIGLIGPMLLTYDFPGACCFNQNSLLSSRHFIAAKRQKR